MGAFWLDWLNLLIRWFHLVVGIGWIGASFYFVWLDFSLRRRDAMPAGVAGTSWMVHGGGFYHVEKYLVAPAELPADLHWFKWEAYLTFLSGFALLAAQYYWNASVFLIDPAVMPLAPWQAIAVSVLSLAAGWFAYDALCRSPLGDNTALLVLAVFGLIALFAFLFTHILSGRGAFIHVGAMIGTIMAANVFAVIIPNQKKITAALLAGVAPDARLGKIGKQRSLHNTYLTLPVLLFMVSSHYPFLYAHPNAWLVAALIVVAGATIRFFLVRTEAGEDWRKVAWALPSAAAALFAAALWTAPRGASFAGGVSDGEAMAIVQTHCVMCHAARPSHASFSGGEPPKGVILDSPAALRRHAAQITAQVVQGHAMPLGNETGMSEAERARLGAWLAAQEARP